MIGDKTGYYFNPLAIHAHKTVQYKDTLIINEHELVDKLKTPSTTHQICYTQVTEKLSTSWPTQRKQNIQYGYARHHNHR